MNERGAVAATATAPARTRPSRQNGDEAIVVRWRDGIAIVELVSIARRKHRRRASAAQPPAAAPSERVPAPSDSDGDAPEENAR